jgi:hypothetical protein
MMENSKKLEFPEGQKGVRGEPGVPSRKLIYLGIPMFEL